MRRLFLLCLLCSSSVFAEENPAIDCFKALVSEPKFAAISTKLPLGDMREITFQMLANNTLPTKKETKLIAEWVDAKKICLDSGLEFAQKNYPPQIIPIAFEANNRVNAVAASLYNREFTYGAANKKIQSIADEYVNKLTAVSEQIKAEKAAQQLAQEQAKSQKDAQVKAQQDYERQVAAQRQADANARQQQLKAQEDAQRRQIAAQMLMNSMNRPTPYQIPVPPPTTRTVCNQNGTQTICNSN